jgi:hypothetical protein
MDMKRTLLFAVVLLGSTLAGCATRGGVYVAMGPPPPPRYGVLGVAPGPRYVWTDGFWDWRGGSWRWVDGRWMVPPRARAVWVPGHWSRHGRGYRFHSGHWR